MRNHNIRFIVMLAVTSMALALAKISPAQAEWQPNSCIGFAGDSNVYGHVTFQTPTDEKIGIVYVQPLWFLMQKQLDDSTSTLKGYKVIDRSLVASGITFDGRTAYLKSLPYGNLTNDLCRFNIVMPFFPDLSSGTATPEQYVGQMQKLVLGIINKNLKAQIFVLNYYQPTPADFTKDNIGHRLTSDRIQLFNDKIKDSCRTDGSLGRYTQVICVETETLFQGLDKPYVLGETTQDDYKALFYRETGFTSAIEAFFSANPDGKLIGDGIHLSLAGRMHLVQGMIDLMQNSLNGSPNPTS